MTREHRSLHLSSQGSFSHVWPPRCCFPQQPATPHKRQTDGKKQAEREKEPRKAENPPRRSLPANPQTLWPKKSTRYNTNLIIHLDLIRINKGLCQKELENKQTNKQKETRKVKYKISRGGYKKKHK